MSINFKTEEYYKRFIDLQEKLRKSEEERLKLEMKFHEMVRITREEEQMHYRKLRTQYKRFLEEDRRRQDRNERILRSLERIESRVSILVAKTERFKLLRQQYQTFLDRVYKSEQMMTGESPVPTVKIEKEKPRGDDSNDIVQTYLQNLSSNKLREMLKKEEEARAKLPTGTTIDRDKYKTSDLYTFTDIEFRPNYANTIADDIMNSIYFRSTPLNDNKLRKPTECNNNISVTPPVVTSDDFRPGGLKNFDELTGSCTSSLKKDETKHFISGAEDTETDDFSESDEILYKNPVAFDRAKLQNLNGSDKNKNISDTIFSNPVKINTTEDVAKEELLRTSLEVLEPPVERTNEESVTPAESKYSVGDIKEHFVPNVTSVEDKVFDQTTQELEMSENNISCEKTPEVSTEDDISQLKGAVPQPVVTENENSKFPTSNQNKIEETEKDEDFKTDVDKEQSIEDTIEEKAVQEHILQKESLQELLPDEIPVQHTQKEDPSEFSTDEKPIVEAVQKNNDQQQPTQQYSENENPVPSETYEENVNDLSEENINEPTRQYDENSHVQSYDPYNQQYDANNQPIQNYDDQNLFVQNYDESGQPGGQYDETSQPLQQYDEHGQLIQSFDQQGQLMQQYDEHGQFLQQYDEHGQIIPQYDEQGQLIQQYDEQGQLIQQYDDSGQHYDEQYMGAQQQYDENGQPIQNYDYSQDQPQYDENGQLVQQNFDDQQYYPQQYEENLEKVDDQHDDYPAVPQDIGSSGGDVNVLKESEEVKEESQEPKKSSNVMEMLDTDSESVKQDTKISHDSDFDFSNG